MNDDYEIEKSIVANASRDGEFAVAYAILKLADAGQALAYHLKYLGVGSASTNMGAIEYLATEVRDGMRSISTEIREGIEFAQTVKTL